MLFKGNSLMALYPIALGSQPYGDKKRVRDGRTPQGTFYICRINPRSTFRWSFLLSYPNAEDARRGLQNGSIDKDMAQLIVQATRNREVPPQETSLGGGIQIHGGGTNSDWTQGSISLSDEHVEQLSRFVRVGTPVQIR
jgi:murein L,D-transpeptidase YafK